MNASCSVPDGFINQTQRGRAQEIGLANITEEVDWAMAEELAFASAGRRHIDTIPGRMPRAARSATGAVLHDFNARQTYAPLKHIPQSKAAFRIERPPYKTPGSFECGYNIQAPTFGHMSSVRGFH
jgi:2-oxoglutarate dehydrogenase complex dehydrogenase (E1) component-like enzyme